MTNQNLPGSRSLHAKPENSLPELKKEIFAL